MRAPVEEVKREHASCKGDESDDEHRSGIGAGVS